VPFCSSALRLSAHSSKQRGEREEPSPARTSSSWGITLTCEVAETSSDDERQDAAGVAGDHPGGGVTSARSASARG
jgi:hypothetical protein